jgi:hypothetical protein
MGRKVPKGESNSNLK